MRYKMNRFYVILSLLLIMIVGGFYIFKARKSEMKENVTTLTNPIQQQKDVAKIELKANPPEFLERLDGVKPITLGRGEVQIQAHPSALEPGSSPPEAPRAKPPQKIPAPGYNYVGVSITNDSGKIISSSWDGDPSESGQNGMIVVENMGRPQGVDFRPQPVTAMAQEGLESQELKILEQKRIKRKSNFAKSLEKREARRSLYRRN